MRDALQELVEAAGRHADYADARHVRLREERMATRNGVLADLDSSDSAGVGIRVRVGSEWGFAATRGDSKAELEDALERALAVARATPGGRQAPLAPEPPAQGTHASPFRTDPFAVSLEEKLSPLFAADAALRAEPGIALAVAQFTAHRIETTFASTEGALYEQTLTECGGGLAATASADGETQIRSYPSSHEGSVEQAGFEHFLAIDLPGAAPRVAEEAVALLTAPTCPAETTTLILAGEQLGLQVHESVGHAAELDRIMGLEASYAGTSYVTAEAIGSLTVGSPLMNVTADATMPRGLGSFRWDDEGVEGQAVPIVRDGVVRGALSSRETAAELGLERSGGCMRGHGFARQPIVRMTNVNLDPGDAGTLDDLIADTDRGILIETNRSWSIDSRRHHFQFGGEAAWEIVNGERGRLLRNPSYAGVTPQFWAGLDAVCGASESSLYSVLLCGKGEPGQAAHVSHRTSPARFRNVQVGVA